MPDVTNCVLLFVVCAAIGAVATWLAVRVSHATGILDRPGGRKLHAKPVAYLGGLGFTLTVLAGVAVYTWIAPLPALGEQRLIPVFVAGLLAIFLVGLWDDVAGMRPWAKLGCQVAVALLLWSAGVRVERVTVGLDESFLTLTASGAEGFLPALIGSLPSLVVTLGWYVALMNAINLIDGLDGLAGGVSVIAGLSLGAVGMIISPPGLTLGLALPMIAAGGCLGFLFHNWHPAKIFLGDSGSLTIGYTLATASLLTSTKAPALLALLVPMVALGLPLFETAFSFVRRMLRGQNPFQADRRHLHHRLLDAGLDQRRVVLVFLYATLYFGLNAVLMAQRDSALILINVVLLAVGLTMLVEYLKFFERRRQSKSLTELEKEKG